MHFASHKNKKQLGFDFSQPEVRLTEERLQNLLENLQHKKSPKPNIFRLEPQQKEETLQRLKELREAIHSGPLENNFIPRKIAHRSIL